MQKFIVIGNLGKDPEVKSFDNGGKVATFTIADTERGYKTKDGKEIQPHTEWFNCVVRQTGLVGVVEQYLKKGNKVYVEGKIKTREYEKEGQKREAKEVIVESLELLTPKGEGSVSTPASTPQPQPTPQKEDDSNLPF